MFIYMLIRCRIQGTFGATVLSAQKMSPKTQAVRYPKVYYSSNS